MRQVVEAARDRQEVLTLQVPVGKKLQHPFHGSPSVKQTGDPLSYKARAMQEGNKLIGIVTERDIAIRGIADGMGPDAKVRDVMTYEVKYCFEDEEIGHVVENMAELRERCLPVINRDKRPVGTVSIGDLAKEALLAKTGSVLQGISLPGGRRHNQSRTATG